MKALTPREIVTELDKYIIGQRQAKRSVAVALRNRYRRSLLPEELRDEVIPKNILMIGPTGVGKTEIARRLAKLVGAPFVKLEATKFTEVGYVGRDVDSMVRDLVEVAIRMVKTERMEKVQVRAEELADERLVEILAPGKRVASKGVRNPLEMLFSQEPSESSEGQETTPEALENRRRIRQQLLSKQMEEREVEIEVEEQQSSLFDLFSGAGVEQMGLNFQEMFGNFLPKKTKKRRMPVREARKVLAQEEAMKLIDQDDCVQEGLRRAEQMGIIFIDEIDKIAGREHGPDVSREGVQRDILPIVEGSTVTTKHGSVKTDHILFIAAGAFHVAKPSDLIPELQGRFPIRVELESLTEGDFYRILQEPQHSLIHQVSALLQTEGVQVDFTDEAVWEIAKMAAAVNQSVENIGARRLHTLLEKLLEELSFEAPDVHLEKVEITPQYVRERLQEIAGDKDLSLYIL